MKRGQVWIETALYTAIGLALIGLVLAFAMPKIEASKDKLIIEQIMRSIDIFDSKIETVADIQGNIRKIDFLMKRGELYIDGVNDEIMFVLDDMGSLYSEPGVEISVGKMKVLSEIGQKKNKVKIWIDYEHNITYNGKDENRKFTAVSVPYTFNIESVSLGNGTIFIDVRENLAE